MDGLVACIVAEAGDTRADAGGGALDGGAGGGVRSCHVEGVVDGCSGSGSGDGDGDGDGCGANVTVRWLWWMMRLGGLTKKCAAWSVLYAKPETAEKEKARLARRRSRAGESRLAEKGKCCLVSRIDAIG